MHSKLGVTTLSLAMVGTLASGAHASVRVRVAVPGNAHVPVVMRAEPTSSTAGGQVEYWEEVAPWEGELPLDSAREWQVVAEAEGYWSQPAAWPTPEGELAFELLPTGTVVGRWEPGDVSQEALEAQASFHLKGETAKRQVSGSVGCSGKRGQLRCEVPGGDLDIRVEVAGFAAIYLWDLQLAPRATLDIGSVRMLPGASVSGWVHQSAVDSAAKVQLWRHRAAPARHLREFKQATLRHQSAATNNRGFFQITGLSPGAYLLRASRDELVSTTVELTIGAASEEVQLPGVLDLYPQEPLIVFLEPVVDPLERPWVVRLSGTDPAGRSVERIERASVSGVAEFADFAQGRYDLSVLDADDSRWLLEEIDVHLPLDPLVLSIDVVPVRGVLLLRGEPTSGNVIFGGNNGVLSVPMEADEDGRFEGHLPNAGDWSLEVELPGTEGPQAAGTVSVRPREGKSYAEVEIELSNSKLAGQVVKDGVPAQAFVLGVRKSDDRRRGDDREIMVRTDSDGRFEVVGLRPGTIRVSAYDETSVSEEIVVEIADDASETELTLELGAMREVRGRLTYLGNGVPGATVASFPQIGLGFIRLTDATGTYRFRFRKELPYVDLAVYSPGTAVSLERLLLSGPDEREFVVPLSPDRGDLVFPASVGQIESASVGFRGASIPLRYFASFLGGNGLIAPEEGMRVRFRGVAAGTWTLCLAVPPGGPRCDSLSVLPGQTAEGTNQN